MDEIGRKGEVRLDMSTILAATEARNLVTPFHDYDYRTSRKGSLHGDSASAPQGETLYFGDRSSNMFVRIYNKGAQMNWSGEDGDSVYMRVEMEAKKENAEQLVTQLLDHGFGVVPSLLRHYLDFKVPNEGDTNKCRWDTAPWWSDFLDECEKVRLSVKKVATRTIDSVKEWLHRQAAPSLALLMDAVEKECRAAGQDARLWKRRVLWSLIENGRSRYKSRHLVMLQSYAPAACFGGGL
jgi:DNA relaxase NicK